MEEFRIEAAKASIGTGTSRRYPPHLREMAVRYAKAERKKGVTVGGAARALGVTSTSLRNWMKTKAATVVPVRVRPDRAVPAQSASSDGLVVVTPDGYRIGVSGVHEAVALVRGLR